LVVAIQSVGSWLRAAAVDCVNLHPKGAHQPRRRDPDIAKAEDAADAPRSIRLVLRWLNSPLLRLACSMNRRFAAASASATMCSYIGSAPPPLLAATGNFRGRSRVGTNRRQRR
jgi:hypothetical protein